MAASAARRATGTPSTASSRRCAGSRPTRPCSCSPASRSACFRTHADAPRVLIANSNLVPHWATWEHFHELDRKGLMMYGQMTAGSWIYIGTQGIVQGTYETFVGTRPPALRRRSLGPLAADRGPRRHGRRAAAGRDDGRRCRASRSNASRAASRCGCAPAISTRKPTTLDEALARSSTRSRASGKPISVGLLGNAADIFPELLRRGVQARRGDRSDIGARSGQRLSAEGWTLAQWEERARARSQRRSSRRRARRWPSMCARCWSFTGAACRPSTTATTSGRWRRRRASPTPSTFPGFVPAYIRPLFCRGIGPFRWAALSGDPEDIYRTDAKVKELMPDDKHLHNWLDMARARISFQGLPARICWVGLGDRHRSASRSTKWWRRAN